jgi:hypothetical protein
MLRITIELVPYGDEARARVIGTAKIWNDGTSDERPMYGNYEGIIDGQKLRVEGHERREGVWTLVYKFLCAKLLPNIQGPVGESRDSGSTNDPLNVQAHQTLTRPTE